MKTIKTILYAMAVALCATAQAQPVKWGSDNASITRQGDYLSVDMTFNLNDTHVASDQAILLTPCLVSATDTLELPSVGIYGRNRYFYYQRRSPKMISGSDETVLKESERPAILQYSRMVPYIDALDNTQLIVKYAEYGCCAKPMDAMSTPTGATYRAFRPWQISPVYVTASAIKEKTDSLVDRAYVSYVVNRTEINPDYRDNYNELGKIRGSIDMVIDDPDCTITGIWLKGFASPEGKYAKNTELAKGRTQSLKDYIRNLYAFPAHLIATDYEPEDWDGLRAFVEASNLDNRQDILRIIDLPVNADEKEAMIKKAYPSEYAFLLEQVYPTLRHTDYRIDYNIRHFTDIDEIRRIFKTQPRKLDLNELYLLASVCEPGSDEFNAVYQTAAKMYPNDETANLNAANAALQTGDLTSAAEHLKRAGSSIEAQYARGILALLNEDYATARTLLEAVAAEGIENAANLLDQMNYNQK